MNWVKHYDLTGKHALLGASKWHWINYDDDRLVRWYKLTLSKVKGVALHEFASQCLKFKQRLPKCKKTLNMYVNDSIDFNMRPEQILYYSDNCFGTADAISFNDNELRIHDLKTGIVPAHMEQLDIYAALFCLEYNYDPMDIFIELRIYQDNKVLLNNKDNEFIKDIMEKIKRFDTIVTDIAMEEYYDVYS